MNRKQIDQAVDDLFENELEVPDLWALTIARVESFLTKDEVRIMLKDTDLGKSDSFSWNSILLVYSRLGGLQVVLSALYNGADVHYLDDSALRLAANNGKNKVVKALLDWGANPNGLNWDAFLHMGKTRNDGYEQIAEYLFNAQKKWGKDNE